MRLFGEVDQCSNWSQQSNETWQASPVARERQSEHIELNLCNAALANETFF